MSYTRKNSEARAVRADWSFVPMVSLAECMARMGTPTSTVLMDRRAEEMAPRVAPPLMSERLENFL